MTSSKTVSFLSDNMTAAFRAQYT